MTLVFIDFGLMASRDKIIRQAKASKYDFALFALGVLERY
jgi:hypothetical protein